jgi:hypothetical protein
MILCKINVATSVTHLVLKAWRTVESGLNEDRFPHNQNTDILKVLPILK